MLPAPDGDTQNVAYREHIRWTLPLIIERSIVLVNPVG